MKNLRPSVIKHALTRKLKITVKKPLNMLESALSGDKSKNPKENSKAFEYTLLRDRQKAMVSASYAMPEQMFICRVTYTVYTDGVSKVNFIFEPGKHPLAEMPRLVYLFSNFISSPDLLRLSALII